MTVWRVPVLEKFWRTLTMRERTLAALTAAILLSALLYWIPYSAAEKEVLLLKAKAEATEKTVQDLTAKILEIQNRAVEIKAGLAGLPIKELISDKSVMFLLDDVSMEARRTGVNILSVNPSRELDREQYREVSMNMDLKGRYRQMGEYFKRLESLARIVNIRNVRMEACPDTASVCAVRVEAVAYMAK